MIVKELVRKIQKESIVYLARLFLRQEKGKPTTCTPSFSVIMRPKNGQPIKSKTFLGDPILLSETHDSHDQIVATIIHRLHKDGPNISSVYVGKMFKGICDQAVLLVSKSNR